MRSTPFFILLAISSITVAQTPKREVERSADRRDKVICKRYIETGSLVKSHRTCQTKAEWDLAREKAQQTSASASCAQEGGACR